MWLQHPTERTLMESCHWHAARPCGGRQWLGPVLVLALVTPCVGLGQTLQVQVKEPAVVLALLTSGEPDRVSEASTVIYAAFERNYSRYTDAERQQLLDGVERVARGEVQADVVGIRRAVTVAFSILNSIAMDTVSVPEDREIARRLLRIYRQTDRVESKGLSVSSLGRILPRYPAERAEIDSLLFSVASAPIAPDRVHPQTAVDALLSAGEAGVPALRRLHEQRAVKDFMTAAFLGQLAERGYRRPDGDPPP